MGYDKILFNCSYGLIDVPVATTLNLNDPGSPAPFPPNLRKALPEKSYRAWQNMNDNPEWVKKVQNNQVSYEEFQRMGEE